MSSTLASRFLSLQVEQRRRIYNFVGPTSLMEAFRSEDLPTRRLISQTMSERMVVSFLESPPIEWPPDEVVTGTRELLSALIDALASEPTPADHR